ncbi:DEAD/DEAH box helicase [Aerococcus urinaehominis]|uniref:ATP-dependent RNA helicase CshA n=1 Tax=Aerococcus urinaehominis TaxID=128944 RepID=A0A0X8FKW3_9LACT|nr:DEAD/DEAH box helicase [Aerococcus urinaehominis]AMB99198.1 DEAD/DEAH box helicase [Aerococcus urinaehominis]SDM32649.1 ATP-dependent RNA helicase DeaD [Aerococcus urinaehominis]
MKFNEMPLQDELVAATKEMGFEEASPIQAQTIPYALEGRDVLGMAQTGTGKTAAFGLPLLQKIETKKRYVQALVIAPTRELAIQTGEELYRLGKHKQIRTLTVYGGAHIGRQMQQLNNHPPVVVGTPGRLLDLIKRNALHLDHISTLVLDEADEMLNMGFIDDIEAIIKKTPHNRQTLLFSATMPAEIKRIGEQFMQNPVEVKIKAKEMTADLIDQYFTKCRDFEKFDLLTRFVDVHDPDLAIVFARTKRRVDEVSRGLIERGYRAEGIHGDLTQQKRMQILKDFKAGNLDLLVATDVAARGLDISGVTHVYNFDIPQDPESYVHRIGRTGRAGKEGMSVTFVVPHEMGYLRTIEDLTRKQMSPLRPPTDKEALTGQLKHTVEEVDRLIDKQNADDEDKYQEVVNQLLEAYTSEQLAMALVTSLTKANQDVEVKITPDRTHAKSKHHGRNKGKRHNNRQSNYKQANRKGKSGHHKQNRSNNQNNRSKSNGQSSNRKPKSNHQFKIK